MGLRFLLLMICLIGLLVGKIWVMRKRFSMILLVLLRGLMGWFIWFCGCILIRYWFRFVCWLMIRGCWNGFCGMLLWCWLYSKSLIFRLFLLVWMLMNSGWLVNFWYLFFMSLCVWCCKFLLLCLIWKLVRLCSLWCLIFVLIGMWYLCGMLIIDMVMLFGLLWILLLWNVFWCLYGLILLIFW